MFMETANEKRKCIFTGKIADKKLVIPPGKVESHNWAKSVPCSSEYLEFKNGAPLSELEIQLVDLFYQQELHRIKVVNCEMQMAKIRHDLELANLKKETLFVSDKAYEQIIKAVETIEKPNQKLEEAMVKHEEKFKITTEPSDHHIIQSKITEPITEEAKNTDDKNNGEDDVWN
jgi:hypothetical protein